MLTTLLAGLLTLVSVTSSFANSFALSEATVDWSSLSFTTTGTLVITRVDDASSHALSYIAAAQQGGQFTTTITNAKNSSDSPLDWHETAAAFSYTTMKGFGTAIASTAHGVMHATSVAGATLESASVNQMESGGVTDTAGWLYGSGMGEVVVSVPYHLSLTLLETQSRSVPGLNDLTAGMASVSLFIGPGTEFSQKVSLAWPTTNQPLNNTLMESGILRSSTTLNNPTWGPLFDIGVSIRTIATASTVPEPTTWILLAIGLGLLMWVRNRSVTG